MNTHVDKTSENKSQAVANSLPKLQSNSESTFQFMDNRPETIAQRKLQEAINNNPHVQQLKAYQEMANSSQQVKQLSAYQAMADNFSSQTAQRKENLEEETLQGKFEPIQKKENNTGLPDNLKSGIENLSGYSMDNVKVHYNSDKPAQLQAHAYAQGTDIHLGAGQEKHLPHEAWHVVQQKQGRVKPTMQIKNGINVNDNKNLESEAETFSLKVAQLLIKSSNSSYNQSPLLNHEIENNRVVQRYLSGLEQLVSKVVTGATYAANIYGIYKTIISYSDKFFGMVSGYHATPNENIDSIKQEGLDPKKGGKEKGASDLLGDENREHFVQESKDNVFIAMEKSQAEYYRDKFIKKGVQAEILEIKLPLSIFQTAIEKDPESLDGAYRTSSKIEPTYIVAPSGDSWMKKLKLYCTNFDFGLLVRLVKNELNPEELDHVIAYFSVLVDFIVWYFLGPMMGLLSLGAGVVIAKRREINRIPKMKLDY